MNKSDWTQIIVYIVALIALTPPLGLFMARVFEGQRTFLSPILGWLEHLTYKLVGCDPHEEMNWKEYAKSLLYFNFFGFLSVFLIQIFQSKLPFNPEHLPNVGLSLALNTAVSFMTNTNWQAYSGESTLSYFTQFMGLTVQNFVSAATGIAVLLALIRGFTRKTTTGLGNFWADMTRTVVYVLLPLALFFTFVLVSQGVVQTFTPYVKSITLEGIEQIIPLGPAASQVAIKQLGTNGGGFFGVNSAHPFENPTPFSNFLEMFAILIIPAALTYTYGVMVKSRKQGWALFTAMMILFLAGLAISLKAEFSPNPVFQSKSYLAAPLLEGKETRFGVANSVLWSVATTDASNGSVNAMHSSLTPLSGGVALFNIMLGEVIFGGVGAGLYGMLVFVLMSVFLAGLMVGRTPEYLGKKIEALEIKMIILAILAPSAVILLMSGISAVIPAGLSGLANKGPHGLSEILYAFSSAAGNNGSAFAGLNANTDYYNILIAVGMLVGRFAIILPLLRIAGSLVEKRTVPISQGTFPTDSPLFIGLLIGVILIVGALTFLPALSLGPLIEHFLMMKNQVF